MEKYYTTEEISKKYASMSLKEKNEVSYMQSYNGRSRFLCIALAMGYDSNDGDTYFKRW